MLAADAPRARFAGGLANFNYRITLDGGPAVLRIPPPGPAAEGANDMAREWRVLSRLHAGFPLAPRGLLFCDDPAVLGRPFQLIEFRDGIAIGGATPPGLPADAAQRLTSALLDSMAALHALDPATVGLGDLGKPAAFLARQVAGWARRSDAVWPEGPPPDVIAMIAWLRGNAPADAPSATLLHMDPKLDNLLVDPVTLAPVALIDWDMATRGDPLFDLAVLLSYWIEPGDAAPLHALAQLPTLEAGWPTRTEVAQAYFKRVGTTPAPLAFHLTLARLRLGVAWMQLYRRWRSGQLTGDRYAGFEDLADAILAHAADQLGQEP